MEVSFLLVLLCNFDEKLWEFLRKTKDLKLVLDRAFKLT